jgi:hypothetical protein
MTDQSAAPELQQGQARPPQSRSNALTAAVIAVAGGLLTWGALYLVSNSSTGDSSSLSTLPIAEIAAATPTIDPAASAQLAAGAKNCTVPLAHVSVAKKPGAVGGTIRIRSGDYVSPAFEMTDAPQQIAIPFPAPYPLGHGTISIEGSAGGAVISLYPAWNVETLSGSAARNVIWKPGNPCQ